MNRDTRVNSDATKGLLGRQLASITETLARASRSRDALQKRTNPKPPPTPAVQVPSPTGPFLISDMEGVGSDCGGSVVFGGHREEPSNRDFLFGMLALNEPQGSIAQGSLPGGYTFDEKNTNKLLARLGPDETSTSTHGGIGSKHILSRLSQLNLEVSSSEMDDPKKMPAEMSQVCPNKALDDYDVDSMLANLEQNSPAGTSAVRDKDIDPKQLFAQFGKDSSTIGEVTIRRNSVDDPKGMLADLEAHITSYRDISISYDSDDNAPRATIANLERRRPRYTEESAEDDGEDLEVFHKRLIDTISPGPAVYSRGLEVTEIAAPKTACDPVIVPYVIAIQLEHASCNWDEAKGWTTYLFSRGLDGYKAGLEKDRIVKQSALELDNIISYTLGEEQHYLDKMEEERLPRRLLVSNLAADADLDDLSEFFHQHRFVVQEYKISAGRDPVKRTRTAQVDMVTREAAIKASYIRGSIFGLVLKIKLAVENEG